MMWRPPRLHSYNNNTIMIRSRLKNPFDKTRSDENWSLYKTQREFCTKFFKKGKEDKPFQR